MTIVRVLGAAVFCSVVFALCVSAAQGSSRADRRAAGKPLEDLRSEFPASPLFVAEYAKIMGQPIPATLVASPE